MLLVGLVFLALLKYRPRPARPQPKEREGVLHPDDPLYDSFRRHDQYGKLGADPQPLLEYLRLAFLLTTVVPLRFIAAFSCVFGVHVMCRHAPPRPCEVLCMHGSLLIPILGGAPANLLCLLLLYLRHHHSACRIVGWTLPKEMQARVIAVIGKFMSHLCLASLGFFNVKWTIDPAGQLPPGVEPGTEKNCFTPKNKTVSRRCSTCMWMQQPTQALPVPPAAAIVSNHISYMDIIVHLGHSFPSFVARGNTKDLPLIGLIR